MNKSLKEISILYVFETDSNKNIEGNIDYFLFLKKWEKITKEFDTNRFKIDKVLNTFLPLDNSNLFRNYDLLVLSHICMMPPDGFQIMDYLIENQIRVPILYYSANSDIEKWKDFEIRKDKLYHYESYDPYILDNFLEKAVKIVSNFPVIKYPNKILFSRTFDETALKFLQKKYK